MVLRGCSIMGSIWWSGKWLYYLEIFLSIDTNQYEAIPDVRKSRVVQLQTSLEIYDVQSRCVCLSKEALRRK